MRTKRWGGRSCRIVVTDNLESATCFLGQQVLFVQSIVFDRSRARPIQPRTIRIVTRQARNVAGGTRQERSPRLQPSAARRAPRPTERTDDPLRALPSQTAFQPSRRRERRSGIAASISSRASRKISNASSWL